MRQKAEDKHEDQSCNRYVTIWYNRGIEKLDNKYATTWDIKKYTTWDKRDITDNRDVCKWYRDVTLWDNRSIKMR